jgi:CHAT domain-containing protein/tetratricopeptide (TPR) repeat protein
MGQGRLEPLTVGGTIERKLGQEPDVVPIAAPAGSFLVLEIRHTSAKMRIHASGPNGARLFEAVLPPFDAGYHPIAFQASVEGVYTVSIESADRGAHEYRLRLASIRKAEPSDEVWVSAARSFYAGRIEREKETDLKAAVAHFEAARMLWKKAGERKWMTVATILAGEGKLAAGDTAGAIGPLEAGTSELGPTDDPAIHAPALNFLTVAYLMRNDPRKAIAAAEKARAIAEGAKLTDALQSAISNLSAAYHLLGDRRKQYELQDLSLAFARKSGDQLRIAVSLLNGAVGALADDEYSRAIQLTREALDLFRKIGNARSEALALYILGETYRNLGRTKLAAEYIMQALRIYEQHPDPYQKMRALNNIGLALREGGEHDKAMGYFEQALALARSQKDQRIESTVLLNIGALLDASRNDSAGAMRYVRESLQISRDMKDSPGELATLYNVAKLSEKLDNRETAIELWRECIDLAKRLNDLRYEADSRVALAAFRASTKSRRPSDEDLIEARSLAAQAIGMYERLRQRVTGPELRAYQLAMHLRAFDHYLAILMQSHERDRNAGYDRRALEISEQMQSRSLLDTLAEARVDLRASAPADLLRREEELRQHIDELMRRGGNDAALLRPLAEMEELRALIRLSHPHYAETVQPKPLRVEELQNLTDPDTVLIEYRPRAGRSYGWLVGPWDVVSFEFPGTEKLEPMIRELQEAANRGGAGHVFHKVARELGLALLQPVTNHIAGKRLAIVAAGVLQYVPFGALLLPGSEASLLSRHDVIVAPSGSALALLRQRQPGPRPDKQIAVVADPVFAADDPRLARMRAGLPPVAASARRSEEDLVPDIERAAGSARLQPLKYAREEAAAIASLARSGVLRADGLDASRSLVLNGGLSGYGIVHFATHGFVNSEYPEASGLALSMVDRNGKEEDGYLRLHHIYGLKLQADLVVLSACRTAIGKEIKGEGIMGLTRGFLFAGARRVVASLWNVDDRATAELMKRFYDGMLRGKLPPAAALRRAQLEVSRQPQWRSPYYWAGFQLYGDWR